MTRVSHSSGGVEESETNLQRMKRQIHLSTSQFEDFIDCELAEEGYREILRDKGYLPDPTPDESDPVPKETYEEIRDRLVRLSQSGLTTGEQHSQHGKLWGLMEQGDLRMEHIEELEALEDEVL